MSLLGALCPGPPKVGPANFFRRVSALRKSQFVKSAITVMQTCASSRVLRYVSVAQFLTDSLSQERECPCLSSLQLYQIDEPKCMCLRRGSDCWARVRSTHPQWPEAPRSWAHSGGPACQGACLHHDSYGHTRPTCMISAFSRTSASTFNGACDILTC